MVLAIMNVEQLMERARIALRKPYNLEDTTTENLKCTVLGQIENNSLDICNL